MADKVEIKEPVETVKTTETGADSESTTSKLSSMALDLLKSDTARLAAAGLVGGVAGAAAAVAVGSALEAESATKKMNDSECVEEEESTLKKAGRIALAVAENIVLGPVVPLVLPNLLIDDSKKDCVGDMKGKEFIDDKKGVVESPSTTDKIIEEIKSTPSDVLDFVKRHPYLAAASFILPAPVLSPIPALVVESKLDKFLHDHK